MKTDVKKGPNIDAYLGQLKETLDIPGDVAECGIYKGFSTHFYATFLSQYSNKKIYAFDSFCGFPQDSDDDVDLFRFSDVSFEKVKDFLSGYDNVVLCSGFFSDTFPDFSHLRFSCVILDCDLYQSYKTCLEFFYPRLSSGGVIILDEYYSERYPLAKLAVDEFCELIKIKPDLFYKEDNGWERWRIVK